MRLGLRLRLGLGLRLGGSGFGLGLLFRSGGWVVWGGWLEIWRVKLISTQVVVGVVVELGKSTKIKNIKSKEKKVRDDVAG